MLTSLSPSWRYPPTSCTSRSSCTCCVRWEGVNDNLGMSIVDEKMGGGGRCRIRYAPEHVVLEYQGSRFGEVGLCPPRAARCEDEDEDENGYESRAGQAKGWTRRKWFPRRLTLSMIAVDLLKAMNPLGKVVTFPFLP
jgi:hypothetical protein